MRSITIVGAGQSGLQLGIGLLDAGYQVRIVSNRTPEEIYNGRISSSQCMFGAALAREHDRGIDFWSQQCPDIREMSFTAADGNGGKVMSWASRLDLPAQSVDQRLKIPRWIAEFVRYGGELEIRDASVDDLEGYRRESDLVLVAAGKGGIANLFERDAERSFFATPQRALALTYVTGMTPRTLAPAISLNLVPGVGELIVFPALTTTGPCEIMLLEGVPGGPMDCFSGVTDPQQHLEVTKRAVAEHVPWEAERCRDIQLTDDLGVLTGRFPPTVRRPVGVLPSGAAVLGMADVVVLNDPITGQGSNNASKCAASYLSSILEHADRPFDERFMHETFERYWDYARYVVNWTNILLGPPPQHVLELIVGAGSNPRIARRFVNGFDDPRDFFLWFMDHTSAQAYLNELVTVA
ncbi:styrene monooxygenase/indole monooxygenase family protein [Nocardia sp. NPDC004168]|uniref:styrene monooxygenase/indole monooxygenase family protein n=1 Tax=Nocardia sp. NPDC004168 TaxID=3154452 RepID=UPI0033A375DE